MQKEELVKAIWSNWNEFECYQN